MRAAALVTGLGAACGLALVLAAPARAACRADPFSKPDDLFGQTFTCDDGTRLRYERGALGDTITNEDTGERHRAGALSDRGDEYDSLSGRDFDGLNLRRGGLFGDEIDDDPYTF